MGTIYQRGRKLWVGFKDARGKWCYRSTGLEVGQEKEAEEVLKEIENQLELEKRRAPKQTSSRRRLTVSAYADQWLTRREGLGISDVENERGRLKHHVLADIGHLALADVRPRHIRDLVHRLRRQGDLAPRTVHKVYGVVRILFNDAVVDELIPSSPCVLRKRDLGPDEDQDPEWRAGAVFEREELELLISSPELPWDRRVVYALMGIADLRHGEMAGLRWRNYDPDMKPLGKLVVAHSYASRTKTKRPRMMPVHPTLAVVLDGWRDEGWEKMMGRAPGPDDLIAPRPPHHVARQKSRKSTSGMRDKNYSRRRMVDDLKALGMRHRRGHDLRRTFITLARQDGARPDLLEMVTHAPRGNIMNIYTSMPWEALCAEVAKLRVDPPVKDEAEAMQKAVGADLEPASVTTDLTTVLTTAPEGEAGSYGDKRGKPEIRLVEAPGVEPGSERLRPPRLHA